MSILPVLRTNTILYCEFWPAAVAFYRDTLALPVRHATDWFMEFSLAEDQCVSIADAARTSVPPGRGQGITLSWQVADLDAAHEALAALGIGPGSIESIWGARRFYFYDPEGHRLELWSA